MPKRKANEGATASDSKSPTRKKSKKEQLAAAKQWHEERAGGKSSSTSSVVATKKKAVVSSQQVTTSSSTRNNEKKKAPSKKSTASSNQSPLYGDEKTTGGGGNALLKTLRKQKEDVSNANNDDDNGSDEKNVDSSETVISSLMNGDTSVASSSDDNSNNTSQKMGRGKALLMILSIIINIGAVGYMIHCQRENITKFNREYLSEVKQLQSELAKSKEVNALLVSGINVLEKQLESKISSLGDVPDMYDIKDGGDVSEDDIQTLEMEHFLLNEEFGVKVDSLEKSLEELEDKSGVEEADI